MQAAQLYKWSAETRAQNNDRRVVSIIQEIKSNDIDKMFKDLLTYE